MFQALSVSPSHTHSDYSGTSSGFDFQKPRFCAIPWTNHGKGQLTVKLALFYLCLMVGYGSRHIATWYPQLDTWWRSDTGDMRHNTSGATKRQPEIGDKLEEPRAGVAAQGTAAGVDEQDYEQDYEEEEEDYEEEEEDYEEEAEHQGHYYEESVHGQTQAGGQGYYDTAGWRDQAAHAAGYASGGQAAGQEQGEAGRAYYHSRRTPYSRTIPYTGRPLEEEDPQDGVGEF